MSEETKKPVTEELIGTAHAAAAAYDRYQSVKHLAQQLAGLPASAPLPEHVTIENVSIVYTVNGRGYTAVLRSVNRVGDLADLLAREAESQVDKLRTLASEAQSLAAQIEAACEAAQYSARAQQVGGPQ